MNKLNIPDDSYMMCMAGLNLPCRSVQTGYFRSDLVDIIRPHILYMIKLHKGGHDNFHQRVIQTRLIIPDALPMEVVAIDDASNPEEAAAKLFRMWRKSPGHWKAINSICRYYCYSLGQENNTYYGIGLIIT